MSKKTKKDKKDAKSSILLLLILAIVLIASTYAWFTSNQTVTVQQLEVNVEARNGLQISTDAINWKSTLTTQDLAQTAVAATYPTNVNQIPKTMEPVSTAGNITNGRLDMFHGVADPNDATGEFDLTATKQTDTQGVDGKYIAFDIFLQVNTPTDIKLSTNSSVVAVGDSKGLENASRVGLLKQGNVAPGTSHTVAQALNNGTAENLFLWEPNSDVHTAAGVTNAFSVYGISTTETGATPLAYNGIIKEFDKAAGVTIKNTKNQPTYFKAVTPSLVTPKVLAADQAYTRLEAGITKVRVYMWVEGEDVDCENNASGIDIGYNLQFTIAQ